MTKLLAIKLINFLSIQSDFKTELNDVTRSQLEYPAKKNKKQKRGRGRAATPPSPTPNSSPSSSPSPSHCQQEASRHSVCERRGDGRVELVGLRTG